MACLLSRLVACSPGDAEPSPQPPVPKSSAPTFRDPAAATALIPSTDRGRTIAALAQLTREIDADTARLSATRHMTDLGGGATGAVTVWRADSIVTRVHVAGTGEGFTSADDYWMRGTVLIAAHLVTARAGRPPAEDRVWFRNGALYQWIDADGERLEPAARSTAFELEMLRSRLTRVLEPSRAGSLATPAEP